MTGPSLQDPRRSLAPWSRGEDPFWLIVAFVTPVLVYLPAVIAEYGFSESYRLLAYYVHGPSVRRLMLAEGRPVYAAWAGLVFGFLSGSIRALSLVRLLNITAIGLDAVLVAMILKRAGLREIDAMMGGIAAMMLPSFQLFAGTAAMGGAPVAAIFAAIAALLTCNDGRPGPANGSPTSARGSSEITNQAGERTGIVGAQRQREELDQPAAPRRPLVGCALWLVAAQATYQPAAMLFFAFAAVLLLVPDLDRTAFRGRLRRFAIVGLAAATIEFALFLGGRILFSEELVGAPRAQLSFEPLAKLAWFFGLPMAHATNAWVLRPDPLIGVFLALVLSVGLSLACRSREDRWLRIGVAFVLVPISYLPNLVVVENHSSFRSQPALATLFLFFYVIILHGALRTRRVAFSIVMVAMTVFACITARNDLVRYIVRPQVRELQLVRETLNAMPGRYGAIGVRKSDFRDTLAPSVFYDEFGYPSTALPWSFTELTWLVLREQAKATGGEVPAIIDVLGEANRDAPIVPATVRPDTIIDWGVVLRAERDRSAAH
jgi:hypothetical protein